LTIEENSLVNYNLNFIVGAEITADYSTTDIEIFENYNFSLNVFPNPTIDGVNLKLTLQNADYMQYRVINSAGQQILTSNKKYLQVGDYSEFIEFSETGIFYLEIQIGNTVCIKRVISQ